MRIIDLNIEFILKFFKRQKISIRIQQIAIKKNAAITPSFLKNTVFFSNNFPIIPKNEVIIIVLFLMFS